MLCQDPAKTFNYLCTRYDKIGDFESVVQEADDFNKRRETALRLEAVATESELERSVAGMLDQIEAHGMLLENTGGIDDGDIEWPKNFYEFCIPPRGKKGLDLPLFARQMSTFITIYSEYCPRCSDGKLQDIAVDAPTESLLEGTVLLENNTCPRCKATRLEMVKSGELNDYSQANLLWGQRAGKSRCAGADILYGMTKLFGLHDPSRAYGLLQSSALHIPLIAQTFDSSIRNLWTPFLSTLKASPWFAEYNAMLDYWGNKNSEKYYSISTEHVTYKNILLFVHPSGPNRHTLRGATRPRAAHDEIGLLRTDSKSETLERMSATEVYTSISSSMGTIMTAVENARKRGEDLPSAMHLNISSMLHPLDMINQLIKSSIGSRTSYGSKRPTWEINRNVPFDSEFIQQKLRENSIKTMRDFGCEASATEFAFVRSESVKKAIGTGNNNRENLVTIAPVPFFSKTGSSMLGATITSNHGDTRAAKVLALDAGAVFNSFAFTVGHPVSDDETMAIDMVGEIIPRPETTISFTDVYKNVIVPIVKTLNVKIVVSDRWQNIKLLQDLEEETKVSTIAHSLKYDAFKTFKEDFISGRIILPYPEMPFSEILEKGSDNYPWGFENMPIAHLIFQFLTVQDKDGKVDKGPGATDDILRTLVLCHRFVTDKTMTSKLKINQTRRGPLILAGAPSGSGSRSGKVALFRGSR